MAPISEELEDQANILALQGSKQTKKEISHASFKADIQPKDRLGESLKSTHKMLKVDDKQVTAAKIGKIINNHS